MARPGGGQGGGGQEQGGGRQAPSAEELIARLDKDKDGKISESEFDGPAEHFSQFDANMATATSAKKKHHPDVRLVADVVVRAVRHKFPSRLP